MFVTRFITFSWIFLTALTWTGCSGSKAYVKRGLKMEQLGMMDQAASFYQTAVIKNRNNTDALSWTATIWTMGFE